MIKILLLAISLIGFCAGAEAAEAAEAAEKPCYDMNAVACEVFHLTNEEREAAGKPALTFCERCFAMAQEQSEDMYLRGYFSHARPPAPGASRGETFAERSGRFGLRWLGENIAQTGGGAGRAMSLWMGSPGHRRNVLNTDYTSFAVGYREGFYTQVFAKEGAL